MMILLVCAIIFAVKTDIDVPALVQEKVEGRLLKESEDNYLVDFSKDIKKFDLAGKPEDYKKVLVQKNKCVKE